jgi:hypothetical protein
MLYIFYRYIIGLCAAFMVATSLVLIFFFSDPEGLAAVGKLQNFSPIMTLLHIFTILLAILAILFTHPFITDGEETLEMSTPISHAAIQGNVLLILTMSYLQISATDGNVEFFTDRVVDATAFMLKVGIASLLTSWGSFYAIRYRARLKRRRGEDNNAFCIDSSFRGL